MSASSDEERTRKQHALALLPAHHSHSLPARNLACHRSIGASALTSVEISERMVPPTAATRLRTTL